MAALKSLKLPAKTGRGFRQFSVAVSDAEGRDVEALRIRFGLRSWGEVVRKLIAEATRHE